MHHSEAEEIKGKENMRPKGPSLDTQNVSTEEAYDSLSLSLGSRIIPHSKKTKTSKATLVVDLNWDIASEGRSTGLRSPVSSTQPQDADYSNIVPPLSDELENLIMARSPRSEYWKFCSVNKRWLSVVKSGEMYKIRRDIGFREPSVFVLAGGDSSWWEFNRRFKSWRRLPVLPADCISFTLGDKETLCAGNHLLVSGKEFDCLAIWRYNLATNKWYKGPNMMTLRCLFASATCGSFAYVAGGIGSDNKVLNNSEKYNPEAQSWEPLPAMKRRRKFCSGFFMDKKFYVIGGRDENNNDLTCGEAFDETKNTWDLIPDMLGDTPMSSSQSPPLVAVANNELYSLDTSSNELKVYLKKSVTWKSLGPVPVRADFNRGWGVAFKSLGNELLVIGASSSVPLAGHGMSIFTCCPTPSATEELVWNPLDSGRSQRSSHFIMNCAVMLT
uniref:Uncharacterized protein n=1 Tax=Kalanchoe fedtschenkoi TaxID=63787 RepID=A0A7N0V650_KALFE